MSKALVMIMDRDREDALGMILADDVIVENLADIFGCRDAVARLDQRGLVLFADDVHAQFDAFIADEHRRASDELAHLMLALAAERTVEGVLRIAAAGFGHTLSVNDRTGLDPAPYPTGLPFPSGKTPPPAGLGEPRPTDDRILWRRRDSITS